MTWYEIGAAGEIGGGSAAHDRRAVALAPLLAAALVIALGLVLVGLTSGGAADNSPPPAPIAGSR
jgi:hypothetical protein